MTEPRTALVTGAGSGIGRAVAVALGRAGFRVAINDINPDRSAETARQVEAAGGKAFVHIADISKKFPVQAMFNAVEDVWTRLEVIVNCSQVLPERDVLEMDEWDWRRTLDVNLTGAFLLTQVGGRVLRPHGGGWIVHVIQAGPDSEQAAAVAAGRNGLVGFVRAAAPELAGAGIRLAAVEMGPDGVAEAVKQVFELISLDPPV